MNKLLFWGLVGLLLTVAGCDRSANEPNTKADLNDRTAAVVDWDKDYQAVLKENGLDPKLNTAEGLNAAGLKIQEKKKYFDAYLLFKQTTNLDAENAVAWYNRASALSLVKAAAIAIDDQENLDCLNNALAIDPTLVTKLNSDPNLSAIRTAVGFAEIVAKYTGALSAKVVFRGYEGFEGDYALDFATTEKPPRVFLFHASNGASKGFDANNLVMKGILSKEVINHQELYQAAADKLGKRFRITYVSRAGAAGEDLSGGQAGTPPTHLVLLAISQASK